MPLDARSTDKETDIVPRDLHFDLEGVRGNWWLGGDPVGTAVLNALSLTFPDGERLFVDAVRHFRDATDGSLREDVRKFIAQEAAHSREHHVLNELIDAAKYPVDRIRAHVRERIGIMVGGTPHHSAARPYVDGIRCPKCGRPEVWFYLDEGPAVCHHRNSCHWAGPISYLSTGAR